MRTIAILAIALCAMCSVASAQVAHIGVYADAEGKDCYPRDIVPNVLHLYVVLTLVNCSTAAEFTVLPSEGFDGVFLGEAVPSSEFIQVGNSDEGTAIAFGAERAQPVHILTMSYYCGGHSRPCSYFEVTANLQNNSLAYVDCNVNLLEAIGGRTYINADGTCPCEAPGLVLPTVPSTWGKVKAMYAG